MKKLFFLALLLIGTSAHTSAQLAEAVSSKRLNFAYTFGNPDYVDLSSVGPNIFAAGVDNQMVKARNLKSFAVNFRGWRLLDEFIVDPEFFWELDPIALKGKIRTVNYDKIAKYPSLAKRYKAIKPTGVNFVVCVNISWIAEFESIAAAKAASDDVCFRAQSYQMFWGASRSGRPATYPGALLGWYEGISLSGPNGFNDTGKSQVPTMKQIVSKFSRVGPSSGKTSVSKANTYLDIRWPDDAIDKIYDDFEEYEKEGKDLEKEYKEAKEEPKVAKRAQALTADDEMAQPFEDVPKTAKIVYEKAFIYLVTPKGKKVFSSDKHWGDALGGDGRFFELRLKDNSTNKNSREIVNAAGKRLTVDGHSAFALIHKTEDGSGYTLYVDTGGPDVYRTQKCFAAPRGGFTEEEFRLVQAWDSDGQPPPRGPDGVSIMWFTPYWRTFKSASRITVDSNFKKLGSGPGYITSTERRSEAGDYVYDWPFKWK